MVGTAGRSFGRLMVAWLLAVPLALATPVAALASKAPCASTRVDTSPRATLCGSTTITGSHTGVRLVRLPRPATLRNEIGPDGGVQITGTGLISGFVLVADTPDRKGPIVWGLAYAADVPVRSWLHTANLFNEAGTADWILPAGNYRLYLLSSGDRVQVTLRLGGTSGMTRLAPTRPARFDVRRLEPKVWAGRRTTYSSGASGQIVGHPGLGFASVWLTGQTHLITHVGTCADERPSGTPIAFLPECPNSNSSGDFFVTGFADDGWGTGAESIVRAIAPGTWGLGTWFESVSTVKYATSIVFWLSLN